MALLITRTTEAIEVVHWSDPDVKAALTVEVEGAQVPIDMDNQWRHQANGWVEKHKAAHVGPEASVVKIGPLSGQRFTNAALLMASKDADDNTRGQYLLLAGSVRSMTGPGGKPVADAADVLMKSGALGRGVRWIAVCMTQGDDPWAVDKDPLAVVGSDSEVQAEGAPKSAAA